MTNETKRDRAAEEPNLFDKLAKVLDENNMQVTFTGWKAELEATEKKLASRDAEVQALREENERLKKLVKEAERVIDKTVEQCGSLHKPIYFLWLNELRTKLRAASEPKDTSGGGE